ncbi:MAG: hypothetical protein FWD06_02535 [Oscillospiraceae bacterium]|nr:hypothetical protein [Oscillospiraceae bacterium]
MKFTPDLAGYLFCNLTKKSDNEVYRIAFILNEDVNPARFQQAIDDVRPRFPSFFVRLHRGFMRDSLIPVGKINVTPEQGHPCRKMPIDKNGTLLRFFYNGPRLALELSHAVSDGEGVLVFMKTVLARYLELGGVEIIHAETGLPQLDEPPKPEELRDDYRHFARKVKGKVPNPPSTWKYTPKKHLDFLQIQHGRLPIAQLLSLSKAQGVTATEYLTAAYMLAFYRTQPAARSTKKSLVMTIPLSARKMFGSTSLRNFALVTDVSFKPSDKPGEWSFEEILAAIKGQLAAACTEEEMRKNLWKMAALGSLPIIKIVPNVVLRPFINLGYRIVSRETSCLSNLGKLEMPACMQPHVRTAEITVSNTPAGRIQFVTFSYGDFLEVFQSSSTHETVVQQTFFKILQERGIDVKYGDYADILNR